VIVPATSVLTTPTTSMMLSSTTRATVLSIWAAWVTITCRISRRRRGRRAVAVGRHVRQALPEK
jgi:hypothetical protein